jgi:serine-type D-Ala-D-Ala carboxypeptidase/endopeptidase (penicillin-binding protein 4)
MRTSYAPVFLLFALLLGACATERRFARRIEREVRRSAVFDRAFTGFVLLDPATGRRLCDVNGHRLFTPASNTKILTLYTALHLLGDSLPAFRYASQDTSLWIVGTADPSFLHPQFQHWRRSFSFLKKHPAPQIAWSQNPDGQPRYGPGWGWDDAHEDYQAELSDLPLYGNLRRVYAVGDTALSVSPVFLKKTLRPGAPTLPPGRLMCVGPDIFYPPNSLWIKDFEQWVPIPEAASNAGPMLADTLKKPLLERFGSPDLLRSPAFKTLRSTPLDTVLRHMMHHSDNFVADQLLLVCAEQRLRVMRQDTLIRWMLQNPLHGLPQPPRWADGSGLSRYNLFSPHDVAHVLQLLWREQPRERLLALFPAGGRSGTIANWYAGKDGQPYVFAKTGTLGGVHCLSGYVLRHDGKLLIFSFMHNNFVGSSREWKQEMQRLLERVAAGH